jgi:D-glycero-D-manno-heptose 1,7-bisphosphate phosphatase
VALDAPPLEDAAAPPGERRVGKESHSVSGDGRRAVFLDRDGTLIEEVGFLNHLDRLRLLPRAAEAIRRLNENDVLALLVTNQSGVARRLFDEAFLERVHGTIAARLAESGARLDGIYHCPHHPDGLDPAFRRLCECRKPKPGLILRAAEEHGVELPGSYMVGDSAMDLEAARNAGVRSVLVLTGLGKGEMEFRVRQRGLRPAYVAKDLYDAVEWILEGGEARRSVK